MVAQPNRPDITRDLVVACVEGYIRGGMQPNEAFDQVFDDLRRTDRLADLAELVGSDIVGSIWRKRNAANRRPSASPIEFSAIDPPPVPSNVSDYIPPPVHPIPQEKTQTFFDTQEKVNGMWVRVGDMTKQQCEALSKGYGKQAQPLLHKKRYYLAISVTLQDNEVVKDKFDESKLERLYRRTEAA